MEFALALILLVFAEVLQAYCLHFFVLAGIMMLLGALRASMKNEPVGKGAIRGMLFGLAAVAATATIITLSVLSRPW